MPLKILKLTSLILILVGLLSANADLREIRIPVDGPGSKTFPVWRECVGAGRIGEGLDPAWRRQLEILQKEIGFKRLRAHGLFHDELGVYKETEDGKAIYDFTKIDLVFDLLLTNGIRPFVEFGPSPKALASGKRTTFWWNAFFSVPKDLKKWGDLVQATLRHWQQRYGKEEVATWLFEVWNEPNLETFFQPVVKGQSFKEYMELYAVTARAVKEVDPRFQVGGPATAGGAWSTETPVWCKSNSVPLDFFSTHNYASTGGPHDEFGKKQHYMSSNLFAIADSIKRVRATLDRGPFPGLPLHFTEWSTTPSPREKSHDTYQAAPFILDQVKNARFACQSMSYWVFTDIFEEAGPTTLPFQGCFGMMTIHDVRKPAWHAFRFLSKLGTTALPTDDPRCLATRSSKEAIQVLFWDYRQPISPYMSTAKYYGEARPSATLPPVAVTLAGIPPGTYKVRRTRIGYQANDPYTLWLTDLGMATNLEPSQLQALKNASTGEPEWTETKSVGNEGQIKLEVPMREFDCVLLELNKA